MMNREVREDWKQYLFEEGKDYTFDEAIEKVLNAIKFLKKNGVRVTANMLLDEKKADSEFHLSEMEKAGYIQAFSNMGYSISDCETIVNVIDVIYHWFDVTKIKAYEMAEYAANNRLTVTQTIKDKLNVDFDEIVEFVDTVLEEMLVYTKAKTVECGKEFAEMINGLLLSLE